MSSPQYNQFITYERDPRLRTEDVVQYSSVPTTRFQKRRDILSGFIRKTKSIEPTYLLTTNPRQQQSATTPDLREQTE